MSKGLQALETIKTLYGINGIVVSSDMELAQEKCKEIEKELKVIDIIRTHILDNENYLKLVVDNTSITAEEYQLLLEVIK